MFWMIRNSKGQKDGIFTMAVVGFGFCLVKVLLVGVTLQIAGHEINFGTIDGSTIAAILTPTLGAYVGRKYTDKKYGSAEPANGDDPSAGKGQ